MPRFRRRAKVFEAEQFFADKAPLPFADRSACCLGPNGWYVMTTHGQETRIVDGDWIIPEPDGNGFYPCKPEIFKTANEPEETCWPDEHVWTGARMGGSPDTAEAAEWCGFCSVCGAEKTED